jgi:hypothetical protein
MYIFFFNVVLFRSEIMSDEGCSIEKVYHTYYIRYNHYIHTYIKTYMLIHTHLHTNLYTYQYTIIYSVFQIKNIPACASLIT